MSEQIVKKGTAAKVKPNEFTKEGHKFKHWIDLDGTIIQNEEEYTSQARHIGAQVQRNVWIPVIYTISIDKNGKGTFIYFGNGTMYTKEQSSGLDKDTTYDNGSRILLSP